MKIALLISGRATRYESCLLPFLQSQDGVDIDLFMSINGDPDVEYFKIMQDKLQPWLKTIHISSYNLPNNFKYNCSNKALCQLINDQWMPYNSMSMYYNDYNSFNLAVDYANKNSIYYDYYMKFRADIITDYKLSKIDPPSNKNILFSIVPNCSFISHGVYKESIISDMWVWGNLDIMKIYCNTYNYVLKMNEKTNNEYYIAGEDCITDNVYDNNLNIKFVSIPYALDANRRIFDKTWLPNSNGVIQDFRQHNIPNAFPIMDIESVDTLEGLPVIPNY